MAGRKSRARGNSCGRCFVTGLVAGALLFIAAYFLLPDPGRDPDADPGQPVADGQQDEGKAPRFEFYSILPEMEVAVPDSPPRRPVVQAQPAPQEAPKPEPAREKRPAPAEHPAPAPAVAAQPSTPPPTPAPAAQPAAGGERFVLQAGSFQSFADADRRKARLALLGHAASIQTVTVAGEPWHRVQLGPYDDAARVASVKGELQSRQIETLTLRLKN